MTKTEIEKFQIKLNAKTKPHTLLPPQLSLTTDQESWINQCHGLRNTLIHLSFQVRQLNPLSYSWNLHNHAPPLLLIPSCHPFTLFTMLCNVKIYLDSFTQDVSLCLLSWHRPFEKFISPEEESNVPFFTFHDFNAFPFDTYVKTFFRNQTGEFSGKKKKTEKKNKQKLGIRI